MSIGIPLFALVALIAIIPCVVVPLAVLAYLYVKERRK